MFSMGVVQQQFMFKLPRIYGKSQANLLVINWQIVLNYDHTLARVKIAQV